MTARPSPAARVQRLTLADLARLIWICAAAKAAAPRWYNRQELAEEWSSSAASVAASIRRLAVAGLIEVVPERLVAPRVRAITYFRPTILAPEFGASVVSWLSYLNNGGSFDHLNDPK